MATVDPQLAPLFTEARIGRLVLRNRLVQSPVFTQLAEPDGQVGPALVEHLRARARGGIGLIVTENCAVDAVQGRSVGHSIRADHDRFVPGLARLAGAVRAEGAALAVQLHHAGRQGAVVDGEPLVGPTAGIASAGRPAPRELSVEEIATVVARFAAAAGRVVAAGVDAVELHGAHGYLLSQFLSPRTNRRTDGYGGDLAGRARFPLEVVAAVRAAIGPDVALLYRVSVEETYPPGARPPGLDLGDGLAFCELLAPHVDALDVSVGNYDTAATFVPIGDPGPLLDRARAVRARVGVPVVGVGRMAGRLREAAAAVADGSIDLVALGRSQLADARLPLLAGRGEQRRLRHCLGCSECASFMQSALPVRCVVNPELGRDARVRAIAGPAPEPGRVLVVGGGPEGCEAALVAARRGHDVVLAEAAPALGGQLRAWSAGVLGADVALQRDFYAAELAASGVDVRLGCAVLDAAQIIGYDHVLLATGTVFDGATAPPGSLDPVAVLGGAPVPEGPVAVWGTGETAVHAAVALARRGRRVRLQTPGSAPAADANPALAAHLAVAAAQAGVATETGVRDPAPDGVLVWAGPRIASTVLGGLDDRRVRPVGTRHAGGRLEAATSSGYWTAARLGES